MKLDCEVIRDLLPLYAEHMASPASTALVEEHLRECEACRTELEQIGTLNAKRQKEKILKLLEQWYPQVNAFEAKLKPYDEQIQILRQNALIERRDAERAQWEQHQEHLEKMSLIYELQECRDFIDSIPQDLREQLKEHYEAQLKQKQEQQFGH